MYTFVVTGLTQHARPPLSDMTKLKENSIKTGATYLSFHHHLQKRRMMSLPENLQLSEQSIMPEGVFSLKVTGLTTTWGQGYIVVFVNILHILRIKQIHE